MPLGSALAIRELNAVMSIYALAGSHVTKQSEGAYQL